VNVADENASENEITSADQQPIAKSSSLRLHKSVTTNAVLPLTVILSKTGHLKNAAAATMSVALR